MLTTADKKYLKNTFITKKELKKELKPYATRDELLDVKVDLSQQIFDVKEEVSELRNDFMTRLDAVMGELKAIREEIAVGFYRRSENTERIENHEERITGIETKLSLAV